MKINKEHIFWNNSLLWFVIMVVIGFITTWVRPIVLTDGGEVTYFSMLTVFLMGYILDWKWGILGAFLVGGLRFGMECLIGISGFVTESTAKIYTMHHLVLAECQDIVVGYGLLCVGGILVAILKKRTHMSTGKMLRIGFFVAVLTKYIWNVCNLILLYNVEYVGTSNAFGMAARGLSPSVMVLGGTMTRLELTGFSFLYVLGYVGTELIFSMLVLFLPPFINALEFMHLVVHTEYEEEVDIF